MSHIRHANQYAPPSLFSESLLHTTTKFRAGRRIPEYYTPKRCSEISFRPYSWPEMSTSILTRLGRCQVGFYRRKPVHANSLIRLTHNVFPKVTEVEKIILDSVKVCPSLLVQSRLYYYFLTWKRLQGHYLSRRICNYACRILPMDIIWNHLIKSLDLAETLLPVQKLARCLVRYAYSVLKRIRTWCFGVYLNSLSVSGFFHNGPKQQDSILSDLLNWDLVEGLWWMTYYGWNKNFQNLFVWFWTYLPFR